MNQGQARRILESEPRVRTKALIVAMADSIHVARWLELFMTSDIDFTLISSSPNRRIHPRIESLCKAKGQRGATFVVHPFSRWLSVPAWLLDRVLGDKIRGFVIRQSIKRLRPDFVHALELQNAGYATQVAYRSLKKADQPPLLITNYGSDLFWFERFPKHRGKLEKLLKLASAYSAECVRDLRLAETLGLQVPVARVFPNSGGLEASTLATIEQLSAVRKTIAIKGYENQFGRALLALAALEDMSESLKSFEIVLFSCNRKTIKAAKKLRANTGLAITCYSKNALAHSEILEVFRKSIAYVGVSRSDGISTSMLEAMSQGAVPIQTGTACAHEWITHGQSGFIVSNGDPKEISSALSKILDDEQLRASAQRLNLETIKSKYLIQTVAVQCAEFYQSALSVK